MSVNGAATSAAPISERVYIDKNGKTYFTQNGWNWTEEFSDYSGAGNKRVPKITEWQLSLDYFLIMKVGSVKAKYFAPVIKIAVLFLLAFVAFKICKKLVKR